MVCIWVDVYELQESAEWLQAFWVIGDAYGAVCSAIRATGEVAGGLPGKDLLLPFAPAFLRSLIGDDDY